jgi:ribosome biogenesis GTPase A
MEWNGNAYYHIMYFILCTAGKSTLFNRLMCKEANRSYRLSIDKKSRGARNKSSTLSRRGSGGIEAIVSATPGTTRDRRECVGRIGGATFRLIDTAGVDGERIGHLTTGTYRTV